MSRCSALRRGAARAEIAESRAELALTTLAALDLTRVPLPLLIGRAWELRGNFSAADACYVALTESARAPLLTHDARLANAARGLVPVATI